MTRKPGFFIVGAPKCGTTALYDYLSTHPQIYFPETKEPHYFSRDLPRFGCGWVNGVERFGHELALDDYLALYRDVSPVKTVYGDASVMYLFSEAAVRNILDFNPDAKLVVMLRDPVDMAHALHSTWLKECIENEPDFETAWRLQSSRASGQDLPSDRFCPEPVMLQYGRQCLLGEQVERVLKTVPREQVRIHFFDDFVQSPDCVYRDILRFLRLPHDGRSEFPKVNAHRVRSKSGLARIIKRPPFPLNYLKVGVRWTLHRAVGPRRTWRMAETLTTRSDERAVLSEPFRTELEEYFRSDQEKLAELLGRPSSRQAA